MARHSSDDCESVDCAMTQNLTSTPRETVIQKTEDGCYLVCVSDGICTEFRDLWEAEEHTRNLEKAGLPTKRWTQNPSW